MLAAHAAILALFTKTENQTTTITDKPVLAILFYCLAALASLIYVSQLLKAPGTFEIRDVIRMLIPAGAFIGWTMLQKATAFDPVDWGLSPGERFGYAIVGAIFLGVLASFLSSKKDRKIKPAGADGTTGND